MDFSTTSIYDDVYKYLSAKFPELPAPAVLEAASYIAHRAMEMTMNSIVKRDEMWTDSLIRNERKRKNWWEMD